MSEGLRVAVISHQHPHIASGGAQEAAHWLFRDLKREPGITPVFVGRCVPEAIGHAGAFGLFRGREDEILWSPPPTDGFRLITTAPAQLRRQATELCEAVRPDIIHLHHYFGFGTDLVRILQEELGIPVVLTLWEYLAICHREGQMLKTNGRLCYTASHAECSACFPSRSAGKFFLRKALIQENLAHVDLFIAPSAFLAERYVDWGIAPDRIEIVETPLPAPALASLAPPAPAPAPRQGKTRFAYFGRLTPYKGVDVLLAALGRLDAGARQEIEVFLYGFDLDPKGSAVQRKVAAEVEALKGCVFARGTYRNEDVTALMRSVDWIVVPSIWWESYSFIVHEAKAAGVPILCSDIGLMREKVRPGIDGVHFMVGNSADLADKMDAIAAGKLAVAPAPASEPPPSVAAFTALYRRVVARRRNARERELPSAAQ